MAVLPICLDCKHLRIPDRPGPPLTCAAFPAPDRIPRPILRMEHDHHEPYPGDRGIQFEPREGAT